MYIQRSLGVGIDAGHATSCYALLTIFRRMMWALRHFGSTGGVNIAPYIISE